MRRAKKYLFFIFIGISLFALSSCTRHFCSDEDRMNIINGLTQQTFIQEKADTKAKEETVKDLTNRGISITDANYQAEYDATYDKLYNGNATFVATEKAKAKLAIDGIKPEDPAYNEKLETEVANQLAIIKEDAISGSGNTKKDAQKTMGYLFTTATEHYFSTSYPKACIATEDTTDPVSGGKIEGKTWFDSWKFGPIEFIFVYPIAWLIIVIAGFLGNTAGAAVVGLIVATVLVRLLTLTFTLKSTVQSQKLQTIQPEITAVQAKYANSKDPNSRAMQGQEIMKIYNKHGIKNPLSPLISPFITLPVFIAMWGAVNGVSLLRVGTFLTLNLGDQLFSNLGISSGSKFNIFAWILLVIMIASQFLSMKLPTWLNKKKNKNKVLDEKTKAMQSSTNMMSNMMLVMIVGMGLYLPTAMSIYWTISSLLTIAQQFVVQKWLLDKEK
jgi:YidC/Oxa1 family membrane protein insertase